MEKIIAVDFDGTLCEESFPDIGAPKQWVINALLREQTAGAKIILWTCRNNQHLEAAVDWCKAHGIIFDAVNENLPENIAKYGGIDNRKVFATEYWDDKSVPLDRIPLSSKPYNVPQGFKMYVHYGADTYDPSKVQPIKNDTYGSKPIGGFWGSAEDAEFGWDKFCRLEDYKTYRLRKSFRFTLTPDAKVYRITDIYDAMSMPQIRVGYAGDALYPDYEELMRRGYDAVEVLLSEDMRIDEALYGWSCDSILVMNKDVIRTV